MLHSAYNPRPISARAGVGLKPEHYHAILETRPDIGWLEIIAENYMCTGGPVHHHLTQLRKLYPISLHGVGLSLGSSEGLATEQLKALKRLVEKYQPFLVSEHLSWSKDNERVLNDLLPVPYTPETMDVFVNNIDHAQNYLQRQILIENPSSYFQVDFSTYSEWDFLIELAERSGAGILLDVNNVYVSAFNHGFDAQRYIQSIPANLVQEIHLAGHSVQEMKSGKVLIDDHGSRVIEEVWKLYQFTLDQIGHRPTLIEWDSNIPNWEILLSEANMADTYLLKHQSVATA